MATSARLIGANELKQKFATMGKDVPTKVVTDAAKVGGNAFLDYVRENILKNFTMRTWGLYDSLKVVITKAGYVRAGSYGIPYNRIHEFGGVIKPTRSNYLSWVDSYGARHFAGQVTIPARPYLRPAYDEHKDDIITVMSETILDYLNRV